MKHYGWILLCLLIVFGTVLSCSAETRESAIYIEGEKEIISETLYKSHDGFTFWYADERLEVNEDEDGVYLEDIAEIGYLEFTVIGEEEADEWISEHEELEYEEGDGTDILYFEESWDDDLTHYFALITTGNHAVSVMASWPEEANEGLGKYFIRVVQSVSFESNDLIMAEWVTDESSEDGLAAVSLTVAKPVTDIQLLNLVWGDMGTDGMSACKVESAQVCDRLEPGEELTVAIEFVGEMPNNGIAFTDEEGVTHRFALDISGEDGGLYFWALDDYITE